MNRQSGHGQPVQIGWLKSGSSDLVSDVHFSGDPASRFAGIEVSGSGGRPHRWRHASAHFLHQAKPMNTSSTRQLNNSHVCVDADVTSTHLSMLAATPAGSATGSAAISC